MLLLLLPIGLIAQSNKVSYTYDQAGNRITRTITLNSAGAKQHTETTDSVVVKDMIGERTITVYPNPTKGALNIEITGGDDKSRIHLMLFNADGKRLQNKTVQPGIHPIDMTAYPVAFYILKVQDGDKFTEYKIIKQ